VRRDVLKVTLDPDGPMREVHFGMFCGLGIIDRAIRETHRRFPEGRAQGALGGALTAASLIAKLAMGRSGGILAPDRMSIRLDDEEVPGSSFLLVVSSTLEHVFLNLQPFWGTGDAPVRVTTVGDGAAHHVRSLLRVVRGKAPGPNGDVPGYVSRNVDRAEFVVDCGLTIDGELFDPQPGRRVRIEAQENVSFVRS
jgi:hypothetical protein